MNKRPRLNDMLMPQTIAQGWDEFVVAVGLLNAPPTQKQEMRRAFYAGVRTMQNQNWRIAEVTGDDEAGIDEGAQMQEELWQEVEHFFGEVKAGRA